MKRYPFSITKHDHNLNYAHDIAFSMGDMETVEKVNEIRTALHSSSKDGRVGYLTGPQIGAAKELVAYAESMRDQRNAVYDDEFEDEHEYTSCTRGDYGPGNPWDAPGMSIHDFI